MKTLCTTLIGNVNSGDQDNFFWQHVPQYDPVRKLRLNGDSLFRGKIPGMKVSKLHG